MGIIQLQETDASVKKVKDRQYYIDNLRIFLTILVVLHHLAITYGAPGGWYYVEGTPGKIESLFLTMFVASNQAFFMGMFFMISAYFMIPSLLRNEMISFLRDRIFRLGIPILLFFFVLSPITLFALNKLKYDMPFGFGEFLQTKEAFGFGPLWFVEALLIFTILFLVFIKVTGYSLKKPVDINPVSNAKILFLGIFMGLSSMIVRIWIPIGWTLEPFSFQIAHFPQYITLFIIGVLAYQKNWIASITFQQGRMWFIVAQVLIILIIPGIFIFGGVEETGSEPFLGGFTWQFIIYSFWEQIVCVALIVGLIGIFKKKLNFQGKIAKSLSGTAYAVYVFHTPIVVITTLYIQSWNINLFLKFIILSPFVVFLCFGMGGLVKQIPWLRKVF
ncbi:MAG: acyltransferase family protein [Flammeovirgaceae bacterium]|nr:acyltransferase family protein [Flammeovirgaceae bacterium]